MFKISAHIVFSTFTDGHTTDQWVQFY